MVVTDVATVIMAVMTAAVINTAALAVAPAVSEVANVSILPVSVVVLWLVLMIVFVKLAYGTLWIGSDGKNDAIVQVVMVRL